MINLFLLAALATFDGGAVRYDCQAEKQLLMQSNSGDWSFSAQTVDRDQREMFSWTFDAVRGEDGSLTVVHEPGILDALGVGGEYEAVDIAPGQFAFSTRKESNCLLTELGCGALVEISDIGQKRASFTITPMGSIKMQDGSREILQMVMLGTCQKSEAKS
tara:strand:- start:59 stop:541 length:483 start_codon:yes stop_codon:yes gene_type:complete